MRKKTAKHATQRRADSHPQQSGLIAKGKNTQQSAPGRLAPSAVGADRQGKKHPAISDDEVCP
jgi:hypothetical protein